VPAKPVETITISYRTWYPICAGLCPDYDLSVSSDGQVNSHRLRPIASQRHYRVSREQAVQFAAIIGELGRPAKPQPIVSCWHYLPKNDPFYGEQSSLSKRPALVIRWSGATEMQLVRCDSDPATAEVIARALRSVAN
jgi:hypothetical protein